MGFLSWMNPLKVISSSLVQAHLNSVNAANEKDRITADVEIASLSAKRDVLIALLAEPWWTPRSLMGYCVLALVFKLVVWDSALGLGVTPPVGEFVTWISATIIGFYFFSKSAETITHTIANAISRRYK